MSKYTVELRYVIENEKTFPPCENSLSLKWVLANYPLYKEVVEDNTSGNTINRREELNTRIIEHFYFREIGLETVPRFLFALRRKLNEIMPYYNQMYKSYDLKFNPLTNIDIKESYSHDVTGSGSSTSNLSTNNNMTNSNTNTSNGDNLSVESDTPNQEISEADIKSNKYASKTNYNKGGNTTQDNGTSSSSGTSSGGVTNSDTRNENYTRITEGASAGFHAPIAIRQWREIMVNIDMEIINELEELFMGVW